MMTKPANSPPYKTRFKVQISLAHYHQQFTQKLTAIGNQTAELDARLLICHFLQLDFTQFIMQQDRIITTAEMIPLQQAEQQALAHQPISRILQIREFWGLDFSINQHVLDPRADSEILIEILLQFVPKTTQNSADALRFLDLGTGSGCLLLSLLSEYKNATGIGADFSTNALEIAKKNAKHLDLSNRATFIRSNWFEQIDKQQFDIILSNPPYIASGDIQNLAKNVKNYDPLSALDGGTDGLDAYRIITANAAQYLKPNGLLIFEMGFDQADGLFEILSHTGFESTMFNMRKFTPQQQKNQICGLGYDLAGQPRIIISKLKSR